jgi:hypothetical protein
MRKRKNSGVITLYYIHSEKNLTDPFTKGLSRNVIDAVSKEMGFETYISYSIVISQPM